MNVGGDSDDDNAGGGSGHPCGMHHAVGQVHLSAARLGARVACRAKDATAASTGKGRPRWATEHNRA